MILVLSMVIPLLPVTALAAEGTPETPDCYIESSDGSYTGYNWMGTGPAVGDKDVYVHIVGTVPDGWTMVGGKWKGADYACVVLKEPDRRIWWSGIRKEDKPMTIQIHPAEKTKEYTDLLLALLAQACIPALTEDLLPEKDKTSKEARTA